jgi:hypothetical protein
VGDVIVEMALVDDQHGADEPVVSKIEQQSNTKR